MELPRRRFLQLAAGAAALPAVSRSASAQAYPSKPITLIVPYAAGGPTDFIARVLAERMRIVARTDRRRREHHRRGRHHRRRPARALDARRLHHRHRPERLACRHRRDLCRTLPYDLLNDFEPLTLLTDAPFFLAGKKAMPADDLKSLIAWMKANPGKATFGNGGNGSISHICGLVFLDLTKTTAQVVPYRGNAPAMQDLVAGQIDIMIADPVTGVPQVKGGNIKAYGVTAKTRLSTAPDIPTVDEAGLPGYHVSLWHGLWLPKGVPAPIAAKLNAAAWRRSPTRRCGPSSPRSGRRFSRASGRTQRRSTAHQRAEIAKWWPIIKAAGIKVE